MVDLSLIIAVSEELAVAPADEDLALAFPFPEFDCSS